VWDNLNKTAYHYVVTERANLPDRTPPSKPRALQGATSGKAANQRPFTLHTPGQARRLSPSIPLKALQCASRPFRLTKVDT